MSALLIAQLSFIMLFALYVAILKRYTHFQLNRVFLLAIVPISALVPFISVSSLSVSNPFISTVQLPTVVVNAYSAPQLEPVISVASWIYWIGFAFSLLILVRALWKLHRIDRAARSERTYKVSEGDHAFSFFGSIHIGEEVSKDMRQMIVKHESVHRDQLHSMDVLIYAILRVVFWYNPFIHWAAKEVRLNHEFLADYETERQYGSDYQFSLLNEALETNVFQLSNSFYSKSIIKNRIMMMNKSKSKRGTLMAYAMAVPLIVGAIWLNACTEQVGLPDGQQKTLTPNEIVKSVPNEALPANEVDVLPEFPGGQEGMLAYFQDGFKYPEELKEDNVQGKVTIAFVVNEDGSLSDIGAVSSEDQRLEGPAERFVADMPNWNPGTIDGAPVKVKMMLPVMYTMN